jgi:hypothetical protein
MRVQLVFDMNEDGEPVHSQAFEMPDIPRAGDRITIVRPGQSGCTEFAVRRIRWTVDHPDIEPIHHVGDCCVGSTQSVTVECEFVVFVRGAQDDCRDGVR